MFSSSARSLRVFGLASATAAILVVAGCAVGNQAGPVDTTIHLSRGVVHGGQSAIQAATVNLYHTNPAATTYGAPGILIGTAQSDANGNFNITTAITGTNCPAGTQVYLTAAGGYQVSQPTLVNNNMLMMAALGDCSNYNDNTQTIINEVTTVAAAYALSGFTTTALDSSSSLYVANVSAPIANSTSVNSITATTPAGLAHAFLNALKLADPVAGMPFATTSASTGGTTTLGSVPYTEILTLADIMQSCIDSASGNNGSVISIPVSSGGSGYGANITLTSATGTGAAANAIVSGGVVTGLNLTSGGSGYSPTVTISAPTTGTTATAVANMANGVLTSFTITNIGSGYGTTVPTVTISAPASGTTATGTAVLTSGAVTSITLGTAGSGYGPTVTISSPGAAPTTTATATANVVGGVVTSLVITAGGAGYATPTVTVAAPASGTTATAAAVTTGGAVSSISVTSGGSGYTSAPSVTISAPTTGTAATATATIPANSSTTNVAPSTACSKLFNLTPSLAGKQANNTLQAFVNLARNPYPSAAAMNLTTGLLGLISSSPAFSPVLTAVPTDWSLSIVYGGSAASATTGTALGAPYWLGLDANDTVYLGLSAPSTTASIYGVGSYGVAVPAFGGVATGTAGRGVAPDALGNVWFADNVSGGSLYQFNASAGGAPTAYTDPVSFGTGVAVDANNNVWVAHAAFGIDVSQLDYNATAKTWAFGMSGSNLGGSYGIAVDANQNIWTANYYISGASGSALNASVFANYGSVTSPSYLPSGSTALNLSPVTVPFNDGANHPYGIVLDASGVAWYDIYGSASAANPSGIESVTPVLSSGVVTSLTPGTFVTGLTQGSNGNPLGTATIDAQLPSIDGAGTMFIPDNNSTSNGLRIYNTATGNTFSPTSGIKGCLLLTSGSTACGTTSAGAIYNPRQTAVDSTGSVWAGITSGGVTQVIGIAAPSYPLLSVGKPGLSPGLTSTNPLP